MEIVGNVATLFSGWNRTVKDSKTKVRWDKRIQIRRINVLLRAFLM